MALVGSGELGGERNLLAPVGSVEVELIVVNADTGVRVAGEESDLEVGGEEVGGGGDVEGVDGRVLEDEMRFGGAEYEPDEEDYE